MPAATHCDDATVPLTWSRSYRAERGQVSLARRFLAGILAGHPAADDAVLCLSELMANSVMYSRSPRPGGRVTIRAGLRGDAIRVEVEDDGGPWAQPGSHAGHESGRGLLVVSELASSWGLAGSSTRRLAWFEL